MTKILDSHITCPNCQSNNNLFYAEAKDIEYFTSETTYPYYRCNDCGVLFIYPPVTDLQKIYPPNYYSFDKPSNGLAQKIKNKLDELFFKTQLKQLPYASLKILDIGGGTGWLSDTIKKADHRVNYIQVVDIDKTAAEQALKKGYDFFCGRIEDFESPEKFDVILMFNLIEHVATPGAILAKAKKMLSSEGIIIIKTPNYKSLDARVFRRSNWGGYHCPRHWVIFDKQSFSTLAEQTGLGIKYFTYTQGAPFWTVSILHKLHKMKWIKANAEKPLIHHPLFGMLSMITATFDFARKPFAPLSQMFFVLKKGEQIDS